MQEKFFIVYDGMLLMSLTEYEIVYSELTLKEPNPRISQNFSF